MQPLSSCTAVWGPCAQEDSSLTRSDAYFLDLIRRAGYTLLGSALQRNFPKGLFQVSRVRGAVPTLIILSLEAFAARTLGHFEGFMAVWVFGVNTLVHGQLCSLLW